MTDLTDTDRTKLAALHERLTAEQRRMLMAAASVDAMPAAGQIRRIAELDQVIVAVGEMMAKQIN